MNITKRTTHDVQQGTGPWLRLREGFDTASEAPAALGVSKYVSRAELLRRKHTSVDAEHSPATLGKFAAGHTAEAKARPLAEVIAEGDLYPVTMTAEADGLRLLASLDGLTLEETIAWETKLWNEELAANVRAGTLPEHYTVQMDQELLVSGASRCLFTCTDGTPERFVSCWYEADEAKFAALIAGWHQFHADLAAYTLPATAPAAPVGKAPETLPALRIEVTGAVTASNLAEFKATALAAIRSVNRTLTTDSDFANADKAVKWCADVESRLAAAKQHALSQTASIDALFKAIDDIAAEARTVRLDLDKLVTRRKVEVKEEAVVKARRALDAHIATLNAEIAPMRLQPVAADFAGAIKGKRTLDSVNDALDTTLAAAKIAADAAARGIRANVAHFKAHAAGYEMLFADLGQIVHKADDDFCLTVNARIDQHIRVEQAREVARQAAEAQRIAAAEQRAREQEAARIAEQQRQQAQAEAKAQEKAAVSAMVEHAVTGSGLPQVDPAPHPSVVAAQRILAARLPDKPTRGEEPATLTLGTICERLQFTVRADFLADVLHVSPARVEGKRPGTYTESQFAVICRQLRSHVAAMAELYAGEPA